MRASHTTEVDLPPYFDDPPPTIEPDHDSLRRFETEVVERRMRLTRIVASVVGVAWMLCQIACARAVIGAVFDDTPEPPRKVARAHH
jgi:hypothetical protein